MNRKVLLISNPGESGADNYCEGVNKDVENYKQFLLSSEGGAWYSNEIVHLERPFVYQVEEELEKIKFTDYSMVIFCGHGYVNHSSDTILELRKNIEISSEKFRLMQLKELLY
jgi:4-hydroxy-3-methylbut-2-enyl diphosphate reductase IspH